MIFLRAKLNTADRLLFQFTRINDKTYLLLLEWIKQHAYDKSRFLHGATINEEAITPEQAKTIAPIMHLPNPPMQTQNPVYFLDKLLIFDEQQNTTLAQPLPLIIIGSAGSGKTSVTLEKLKQLEGELLYVSLSDFLVQNARRVYYTNHYENPQQQIDFFSLRELMESIEIPEGREIDSESFSRWANKQTRPAYLKDTRKLFEEFRGVLTGSDANSAYLSEADYLNLGIKQSIYAQEERAGVYTLFTQYCGFLKQQGYYDSNMLSYTYRKQISKQYDAVVIDEVQDFTNSQLDFVLHHLSDKRQFVLSGDANQIVHPNFFSWSKLKSYFYQDDAFHTETITRILANNYRNTPEVTELANRILKLKNNRFGSIDKESHYLVNSTASHHGVAQCIKSTTDTLTTFNQKSACSAQTAILVLTDAQKKVAKKHFSTPLIFTVQEAKGLEYENIILYQFISDNPAYQQISQGVDRDFLDESHTYARVKDKGNKEGEVYKFYINALYVAITRAINNVYLLEAAPNEPLLQLLQINEIKSVNLDIRQSSKEEWQQEAARLAKQGKMEQAQAIEDTILQHKKVPWAVLDKTVIETQLTALQQAPETINKKDKINLLNYAVLYQRNDIIRTLCQQGFKAAMNLKRVNQCMDEQLFSPYLFKSDRRLNQLVAQYGITFRNAMNWTPLMCAAYAGNAAHMQHLLKLGASATARDTANRDALAIAFSRAWSDVNFKQKQLPDVYALLAAEPIVLRVANRLIIIDQSRAEYFLLQALIGLTNKGRYQHERSQPCLFFTAAVLTEMFAILPEKLLPTYRRRNTYISSLLSRNEINSNYNTNRHLFVRVRHGLYRINPQIAVKMGDEWLNLRAEGVDLNDKMLAYA